jgi:hypothetical protein
MTDYLHMGKGVTLFLKMNITFNSAKGLPDDLGDIASEALAAADAL